MKQEKQQKYAFFTCRSINYTIDCLSHYACVHSGTYKKREEL